MSISALFCEYKMLQLNLRLNKTRTAATKRMPFIIEFIGFPSRLLCGPPPPRVNQIDTGRELIIASQSMAIHEAGDDRLRHRLSICNRNNA